MKTAKQFNNEIPVESPVIYTDDSGDEHAVETRSIAYDMCGSVVVQIKGRSGSFDIERIRLA